MTDSAPSIEALLAHADWVRALAGRLVADPALADDVAQRTWLQALRRPPRDHGNLRAWLTSVVRNSARELGRGEGRRAHREAAAARPEATDATVDVVARANLQRELAGEVVALDEPYRTTLLLHFFEGLPAGEVAGRMGCPENTVRTRLRRGLDALRTRLDGRYGDRATWCALLLPLAPAPRAAAAVAATGVGLGGLLVPALAGLLALAGGLILWARSSHTLDGDGTLPELRLARGAGATPMLESPTAAPPESPTPATRTPRAEPRPAAADDPTAAPSRGKRRVGRVIGTDGAPHAHVTVRWGEVEARTDAAGRFELESDDVPSALALAEPGWTWVLRGHWTGTPAEEVTLVAVPARSVAGRVVDRAGRAVSGARVSVGGLSEETLLPLELTRVGHPRGHVDTDAAGHFRIDGVPDVNALSLHVNAPPLADLFGDTSVDLPRGDVPHLDVQVGPPTPQNGVEGIVLDAGGAPAAGAEVHFGSHEARTDASGRFVIETGDTPAGAPLVAFLVGEGYGVRPDFTGELAQLARPWPPVELVLDDGRLALRGRLFDAEGAGASGFEIRLIDGTHSGPTSRWLEQEFAGIPRTGRDGRFEVTGLRDRPYRLRLWHRDGRILETAPLLPGGPEFELALAAVPWTGPLRGRAVGRDGRPIAGVRVTVMVEVFDSAKAGLGPTTRRLPDGTIAGSSHERHSQSSGTEIGAVTDDEGRFVLPRVPLEAAGAKLSFHGTAAVDESFPLPTDFDAEVSFELTALRYVRIVDESLRPGDRIAFLDADGNAVSMQWTRGITSTTSWSYTVDRADRPLLRIEETAVTARLRGPGGGELARVSLDLSADAEFELVF